MKPLTTPKAIIISGIVIALSILMSSSRTSHWLNEIESELASIDSELGGIEYQLNLIEAELSDIEINTSRY